MIDTTQIGYIICESDSTESKATIISQKNNRLIAEGTLQDANVKNRNGRYYADSELFPDLKSERTVELLTTGNLCGEAGHPLDTSLVRQQTIDPTKVAVKYTKIWTDGNLIKSQFKGTPNELGQSFNDFIADDTKVSFSLRALGSVENTSRGAEVKNLKIITWDWVFFPSHKNAYMDKVVTMTESAMQQRSNNIMMSSSRIQNIVGLGNKFIVNETDSGILVPITNDEVIDYIKQESSNIKTIKESFDMLYDSISLIENGNKVQLCDKQGHVFIINLESYIQDEIMNYCAKKI